jgi:hypothetical protein
MGGCVTLRLGSDGAYTQQENFNTSTPVVLSVNVMRDRVLEEGKHKSLAEPRIPPSHGLPRV